MHSYRQYIHFVILFVIITGVFTSCRKLVSIDEPRDTLSSQKMFLTDPQAKSALIGLYGNMIHGRSNVSSVFLNSFAAGLATYAGGLSSGEIRRSSTVSTKLYRINSEFALDIWTSAYNIIYLGNSVIDGIAASTSVSLSDKARKQYTAEAKVLRAFSYFYLVNYFGDVPLVLTVDFQQTKSMKRTPNLKFTSRSNKIWKMLTIICQETILSRKAKGAVLINGWLRLCLPVFTSI